MKYRYYLVLLFLLSSCASIKLCQKTEEVLLKRLDKNYWIIEKRTPHKLLISSKEQFELVFYYPKLPRLRDVFSNQKPKLLGFECRIFEAPYRIQLSFKQKGYNKKKHSNRESNRLAFYSRNNPKSMMQPRTLFFYQSLPIVLTTQFEDIHAVNGMIYLKETSKSALQVEYLMETLYQHFGAPAVLKGYFPKNIFQEMPIEYLEGIQTGKYVVDSVGGILPSWGY